MRPGPVRGRAGCPVARPGNPRWPGNRHRPGNRRWPANRHRPGDRRRARNRRWAGNRPPRWWPGRSPAAVGPWPGAGQPVAAAAQRHGAQRPAQRGGADPDVLQPGSEDHEGDDRPDVAVRRPRRQERADQHGRHAAEHDRGGHAELDMAEDQRSQGRRRGERHRLRQVGPDQLAGAEQRVQEQHQHDHQRAGTHRGQADDQPADHADGDGRQRADLHMLDGADPPLAGPAVQDVAEHHGRGADQQRRAEQDLDLLLRGRGVAELAQQEGAEERHRHRAGHHPADQAQVHRPLVQVHGRADGPHQDGRHQVAGDRGGRLDAEQQDQHRGHQGAPARAGEPDKQPHDRTAKDDVGVEVHRRPSPLPQVTAAAPSIP